MALHEVMGYQAKCDKCGYICDDYHDDQFASMHDPTQALDEAYLPEGWVVTGTTVDDHRAFCPPCSEEGENG